MIDIISILLHRVMHSADVSLKTLQCPMQAELMIGEERTFASKES